MRHSINSIIYVNVIFNLHNQDVPFSCAAPPPSRGAGSNEVPRTVKTFTLSFDLIVVTALPKNVHNIDLLHPRHLHSYKRLLRFLTHTKNIQSSEQSYQRRSNGQTCLRIVSPSRQRLEKHLARQQLLVKYSREYRY